MPEMQYALLFLEGIITFISPCLLPMLPIYLSYFAGGKEEKGRALIGSLGFVAGFTLIFVLMGAFSGTVGSLFIQHQTIVNAVTGVIVILFGLSFLGIIKIKGFKGIDQGLLGPDRTPGFWSSLLFGIVFSIGWTPCVGAFLGSALMIAAQQGSIIQGILLLLVYSLGLGIPFVVSALLIDKLKSTFDFIKKHYKVITNVSGGFLIVVGILMITGHLGKLLAFLSVL
jgi:cytochrome c-type biogenesis protein